MGLVTIIVKNINMQVLVDKQNQFMAGNDYDYQNILNEIEAKKVQY